MQNFSIDCAKADTAIILGSGLSFDLPFLSKKDLSYSQIPSLPEPKVTGHSGIISLIELSKGFFILVFSGRFHLYEGRSVQEVQSIINLIFDLGIKNILITNAAGGISSDLEITDLMLVKEIKEFQNNGNLEDERGLLNCLNQETLKINTSLTQFISQEFKLKEGIYSAVLGPNYETLSEINLFKFFNCSAIGMSTYLEAKRALDLNLNIAIISVITNSWSKSASPTHEEVLENSQKTKNKLNILFSKLLKPREI